MPVTLIAAIAENGVIGAHGRLPWHLPADLKRFKALTLGHHLIIGRATWESIGRPLPNRTFVVVTSRPESVAVGARAVASLEAGIALAHAAGDPEPFVAGGSGIFREALERDLVDRLQLTRIHRAYEGDIRFPPFDESRWRLVSSEARPAAPVGDLAAFDFLVFDRAASEPTPGI